MNLGKLLGPLKGRTGKKDKLRGVDAMTFISTRGQQRGLNREDRKEKGVTNYLSSKSKKKSTLRIRKRVKGQRS